MISCTEIPLVAPSSVSSNSLPPVRFGKGFDTVGLNQSSTAAFVRREKDRSLLTFIRSGNVEAFKIATKDMDKVHRPIEDGGSTHTLLFWALKERAEGKNKKEAEEICRYLIDTKKALLRIEDERQKPVLVQVLDEEPLSEDSISFCRYLFENGAPIIEKFRDGESVETILTYYIKRKDLFRLESLLAGFEAEKIIDEKNGSGYSPLWLALQEIKAPHDRKVHKILEDLIRLLIDYNASFIELDDLGNPVLIRVFLDKNIGALKLLLHNFSVDIGVKNKEGKDLLTLVLEEIAIEESKEDLEELEEISRILFQKLNRKETAHAIYDLILKKNKKAIQSVGLPFLDKIVDGQGNPLLLHFASKQEWETVAFLLDLGADASVQNKKTGRTLLETRIETSPIVIK